MKKIAIFGYSGFASEIADICDALNYKEIIFLSKTKPKEKSAYGIDIVEEVNCTDLMAQGFSFAIGVADPSIKKKIYMQYMDLAFANLVHPTASFGRGQNFMIDQSKGVIIAAGARLMSGIRIGDHVNVGVNATVGHDCCLGAYVSVMPGANISGNVFLDEAVYIGSGAVVLQGAPENKLRLCKSLTIGAGAVVTKSIVSGSVAIGVPARVVK